MQMRTDPSQMRTEIDQETIDAVVALHVSGELDLATVGDLEDAVEGALSKDSGPLLIDLTDCGFIDSSVLSLLVKVRRRLVGSVPARFAVVARDQPLEVLRLTRLDQEIPVFATLADALGALQAGAAAATES